MHSELVDVTPEVREYISQNISSVPEKLREANQIEVTTSIKIGMDGKFEPLQDSVVYTYLPTSYGNLGIPYLINANFITDAGRQQLQRDSEWNKLIFRKAPWIFLKWLATLSHKHPEYYKVLPQRHARIADALSNEFFSSLSEAIREIPFLPSCRIQDKKILPADAYVDRIGFAEVFGAKRFLDAASRLFGRTYNEECEIADADDAILSSYGVKTFDSSYVLRLLTGGRVLEDITIDDNFRLISFLRKTITSSKEIDDLRPVPFLLDDANNLNVVCDLCIPSHFKETNASAKEVRTLNECLYAKLKGTDELRWLQSNFGIKEMSNLGFVEYILHHPDYVNLDNAISIGRFLFHTWKKDNFLARDEFAKEIKEVKFLTNKGCLNSIVNLYLGSSYHPLHDIEKVAPDMDVFVSSKYSEESDSIDEWSFFLKSCGAKDQVGVSQRILDAEPITDTVKASKDLRPYPLLEEAATAFYLKKHKRTMHCGFLNPIEQKRVLVSYFTFIDPSRMVDSALVQYVLNIGLSKELCLETIQDEIFGMIHYWRRPIKASLFECVSSKYKTFLEYAILEKQVFPTTMGKWLAVREVFINNAEITRLAGSYLPVLDIANPIHHSWRKILPLKEKLSLDDYLMLLENISNDAEKANDNKDRISRIYQELILLGTSADEKIREWGKTHKILSKNGKFLPPSELSYITIDGFKSDKQAYGRVDRYYQDQIIYLLRILGVRIIDKVSPMFLGGKESTDIKKKLERELPYIALIRCLHTNSNYEECVDEMTKKIGESEFLQCEKIELSYGDSDDKTARMTYVDGKRFYYTGNLGPGKMELLSAPLCKYLRLGGKDKELLVVLLSKSDEELDEYFNDKGCAADILRKVKQLRGDRASELQIAKKEVPQQMAVPVVAAISVADGQYAGLSKGQMAEVLIEAKRLAKEKLEAEGFVFEQGLCENDFSVVKGVKKGGVEYPLVVHSCMNQSQPFRLNAADWEQLVKPNSILIVRTRQGIAGVSFRDLILNREKIVLSFSTKNLEIRDRIGALADVMRWFSGLHFDFGTLIPVKTGTVQLFDLPEQVVDDAEKQRHMSPDNEEVVF